MKKCLRFSLPFMFLIVGLQAMAQEKGVTKPVAVLTEIVDKMPQGEKQEVRVLTASFKTRRQNPLSHTPFSGDGLYFGGRVHIQIEGQKPTVVKAGEAFIEPPNVKMTGYNRSAAEPLRLVIFYVSDPDTPFLDPVH